MPSSPACRRFARVLYTVSVRSVASPRGAFITAKPTPAQVRAGDPRTSPGRRRFCRGTWRTPRASRRPSSGSLRRCRSRIPSGREEFEPGLVFGAHIGVGCDMNKYLAGREVSTQNQKGGVALWPTRDLNRRTWGGRLDEDPGCSAVQAQVSYQYLHVPGPFSVETMYTVLGPAG